jgi:hypothetical protein
LRKQATRNPRKGDDQAKTNLSLGFESGSALFCLLELAGFLARFFCLGFSSRIPAVSGHFSTRLHCGMEICAADRLAAVQICMLLNCFGLWVGLCEKFFVIGG